MIDKCTFIFGEDATMTDSNGIQAYMPVGPTYGMGGNDMFGGNSA